MDEFIKNLGLILNTTLMYTPPLLFAALGSVFSERSGVVNIGIEGMMTIGAFAGVVGTLFTSNPWLGFLIAGLAGGIFGLLHAFATITCKADQTISGTAINFLAPGFAIFLCRVLYNSTETQSIDLAHKMPRFLNGLFQGTGGIFRKGGFLDNVFNTYATAYLAFILVAIVWFIFYKTKFGLRIRAVGEHPKAADTLGINVIRIRYICVILSGVLAGFGGAAVTLATVSQFRPSVITGQGFIAIAAVIFGKFKPQGAMLACILFGFCNGVRVFVGSGSAVSPHLISMIPYVVTIIVLILFVGKSHVPAANGKPYEKAR